VGAPGQELTLLAGRVVVAARPGWQGLESSDETASVKLPLVAAGREIPATMVLVVLPAAGSLDTTLRLDGGTSFEVPADGGNLRVTVAPGIDARVVVGVVRPSGTFFLSLSLFARDGKDIDVDTLRALFRDQVAPALRFP